MHAYKNNVSSKVTRLNEFPYGLLVFLAAMYYRCFKSDWRGKDYLSFNRVLFPLSRNLILTIGKNLSSTKNWKPQFNMP